MGRRITWGARLRILLHARGVGYLVQLGWVFLLAGVAAFLLHWRHWHLDQQAVGHVDKSPHVARKKDADDRWHVYATYTDAHGTERHVSSYFDHPVGGSVGIHYELSDPSHALIDDGDREITPDAEQHAVILVMIGMGVVGVGLSLLVAWRTLRLVRRGSVAEGTYISRREGQRTKLGQEWYLTYAYEVPGTGTQRVEIYTIGLLTEQPTRTLLYDPDHPSRATALDNLPGSPQLLDDGTVAAHGGGELAFLVPAAALLASIAALVKVASWYVA